MVEHVVLISRDDYEKVRKLIESAIEDIKDIESPSATRAVDSLMSALRKLKGAQ